MENQIQTTQSSMVKNEFKFTHFVREVETFYGIDFIYHRFFNSVKTFADNSLVYTCDEEMTDDECYAATERSYADMQMSIADRCSTFSK